jgi:hypothetical protein
MTAINDWLKTAKAGEVFVYYSGLLSDRYCPPNNEQQLEADAAKRAFAEGKIELCQRRIARGIEKQPGVYDYIAQKRAIVAPPKIGADAWRPQHPGNNHVERNYRGPFGKPRVRA